MQEIAVENVVYRMSAISFRPQREVSSPNPTEKKIYIHNL